MPKFPLNRKYDLNTITGAVAARRALVQAALDLDQTWGWTTPNYHKPMRERLESLDGPTAADFRLAAQILEHAATQLQEAADPTPC